MSESDKIIQILQDRRLNVERRREAEEAYIEALKETGEPEESELFREHDVLCIYYGGRADELLNVLIMLKSRRDLETQREII